MKTPSMTHAAQNSALNVLCRFSAEMAYVQRRLCIRNASSDVRAKLREAEKLIEDAIQIEKLEQHK